MSQQDAHDAFTQTYSTLDDLAADRARRQSANALAAGDGTGARNALLRRGLTADANALEDRQNAATAAAGKAQADQEDDRRKRAAEALPFMGNAAAALRALPLEKRAPYYHDVIKPQLLRMGVDEGLLNGIDDNHLDDDSLDAFSTTVGRARQYQLVQSGAGGARGVDPNTGQVGWTLDPMRPQPPPGWRWSADGQQLQPIPGGGADPAYIRQAAGARVTRRR